MNVVQKAVHALRTRGLAHTLQAAFRRVVPRRVPPHPFDLAHGTDTGGLIRTQDGKYANSDHGTAYWGTAPSLLRGSLALWSATLPPLGYTTSDYTFIDLGCGKGRAVMLASEHPFARALGVELDPELAAIAQSNLALWSRQPHPCPSIEVLHADALTTPIPDTPVLLYLYNPFDDHLIQLLIARILTVVPGRAHPIDILYARPEHAALFEAIPGVQILWKEEIPYTAQDTAADVFDTVQQQCFLYRLPPPIPPGSI